MFQVCLFGSVQTEYNQASGHIQHSVFVRNRVTVENEAADPGSLKEVRFSARQLHFCFEAPLESREF